MENVPDQNVEVPPAFQAETDANGALGLSQERMVPGQPELFTPPSPKPNRFFFGRFGLRAGYGILIVILVCAVLQMIAGVVAIAASGQMHEIMQARMAAKAHPNAPRPHVQIPFVPTLPIVEDAVVFLGLLGVCWLFSRGERRPLRAYGIGSYRIADILPGAFWGVLMLSAVVATLHALHLLVFDGRALSGASIAVYGIKWLFAFLCVGFAEEYMFRGYIQYAFLRGFWGLAERISAANPRPVAFALAAFTTSLIFACAHLGNGGENFFGLVQVFLAGVTFAYALWRTGSLWWGIGFHMTWDWAQSFLFGVADSGNISVGRLFVTHPQGRPLLSGGADGPEGSIFATIALLITVAIIHFTTRPGAQPALEQGTRPIHELNPAPEPA